MSFRAWLINKKKTISHVIVFFLFVNENLSEPARAEIYSHEANEHAHIYVMNGGAKAREKASHQSEGFKETNNELKQRIIRSKKETIKNRNQ